MVCLCFCSVLVSKSNHLASLNMLMGRQYKVTACVLGAVVPGEYPFVLPQNPDIFPGSPSALPGLSFLFYRCSSDAVRSRWVMERVRTALILPSVCLGDNRRLQPPLCPSALTVTPSSTASLVSGSFPSDIQGGLEDLDFVLSTHVVVSLWLQSLAFQISQKTKWKASMATCPVSAGEHPLLPHHFS